MAAPFQNTGTASLVQHFGTIFPTN